MFIEVNVIAINPTEDEYYETIGVSNVILLNTDMITYIESQYVRTDCYDADGSPSDKMVMVIIHTTHNTYIVSQDYSMVKCMVKSTANH